MSNEKFILTEEQNKIINDYHNQLIIGGPGSGKTTISILKAGQWAGKLKEGQNVLFLSFARATVSRVLEAIDEQSLLLKEIKKRINVDTYHAYFWKIIKTHGYLLGLPRKLSILTPSNEAIALSSFRNTHKKENALNDRQRAEKKQNEIEIIRKLAFEKGEIAFDLFAELTFSLLENCNKILDLVANSYPVIILDEFQDTNFEQWKVIQCFGKKSTIIALADSEQRIFDFIGADPQRINHFKEYFKPKEFDLRNENHRSSGTDIIKFGNDILDGNFQDDYKGIELITFPSNNNQAFSELKIQTIKAHRRLLDKNVKDWTLAILVPTKKLMRLVSDSFNQKTTKLPSIHHHAIIDMHGAILSAEVIAFLIQPRFNTNDFKQFVKLICNYFYGKGGDSPTVSDLSEASAIQKSFDKFINKILAKEEIPKNSIINAIVEGYNNCRKLKFTGNPYEDWLTVRNTLESSNCKRLKSIALEARNMRLLDRGTQLREALSQNWRDNGFYKNALEIVRQAFVIEHFSTSQSPEKGIIVMNMHKAKGKQFDEVIVFEGWPKCIRGDIVSNPDRIVIGNNKNVDMTMYKYILRVSVTRAKLHTTIMTPKDDPCVLFL